MVVIVPTPVGVNRVLESQGKRYTYCPHARGGEPRRERGSLTRALIVPTPVGVNRQSMGALH